MTTYLITPDGIYAYRGLIALLVVGVAAMTFGAYRMSRDNRCVGDLGGEGLTPEPTSLPYAPHIEAAIDEALQLGVMQADIDLWELENGWVR